MNILFLGGLFSPNTKTEIVNNSKGVIQYAADTLQWSFVRGFDHFCHTNIISLPFIGSYPLRFKKIYIPSSRFIHTPEANDISVSFFNFPIIKQFFRYYKAKKELLRYIFNKKELTTIVIYSIHSPFLKAATELKNMFPNLRICLIVPDLPEYMSDSKNIFYRFFKNIDSIIIRKALKNIDSFVLLSDHMAKALEIEHKPWIRIEGIFDNRIIRNETQKESYKTILYSGTLARQYGIINLMDAFDAIKDSDYRLWICGEGDCRNEIEKRAKSDSRITYLGQQPRSIVLTLQQKATLLINPRTSEGEYTKYSFPSKTMEYLASGTPCIIYRLEGIPEEYYQYCFVVNFENTEGLKEKILEVCSKEQSELDEFGKKAAKWILENKDPVSQVRKIYKMLNSMDKK